MQKIAQNNPINPDNQQLKIFINCLMPQVTLPPFTQLLQFKSQKYFTLGYNTILSEEMWQGYYIDDIQEKQQNGQIIYEKHQSFEEEIAQSIQNNQSLKQSADNQNDDLLFISELRKTQQMQKSSNVELDFSESFVKSKNQADNKQGKNLEAMLEMIHQEDASIDLKKDNEIQQKNKEHKLNILELQQFLNAPFGSQENRQSKSNSLPKGINNKLKVYKNKQMNVENFSTDNYIYFIVQGQIQVRKHQLNQKGKSVKAQSVWVAEYKENSFFTLLNYREMGRKQLFFGVNKSQSQCKIIKIKFNKYYGYEWYKEKHHKSTILAQMVLDKGNQQLVKSSRFKQFVKVFKKNRYRKRQVVFKEGTPNSKLILVFNGECRYSKLCGIDIKGNAIKDIQRSKQQQFDNQIIDGLKDAPQMKKSKSLFGINIQNNQLLNQKEEILRKPNLTKKGKSLKQEQNFDKKNDPNKIIAFTTKQSNIALIEPTTFISVEFLLKKDQHFKRILSTIQRQAEGYKMYGDRYNNYTATVTTAYLQTYEAKIQDLQKVLSLDFQSKILKTSVQTYITLLRKTDETLKREVKNMKTNFDKKIVEKEIMKARLNSNYSRNKSRDKVNKNQDFGIAMIPLKNQIERNIQAQRQTFTNFIKPSQLNKLENLQKYPVIANKNAHLNKKIQLTVTSSQQISANANSKVYKQSIEEIIKQKLQQNKQLKKKLTKPEEIAAFDNKFLKDLEQIFMLDCGYRSQSINRQEGILSVKEQIFIKKYKDKPLGSIIIDKSAYDTRSKVFKMNLIKKGIQLASPHKQLNYLKGVNMQTYTDRIKQVCEDKINTSNKIKQQFMKIRSQCLTCFCYDNIDNISQMANSINNNSSTLKTSSRWRTTSIGRHCKDGNCEQKIQDEPLEKLHRKVKLVSERSKSKYNHSKHLRQVATVRQLSSTGFRKMSFS